MKLEHEISFRWLLLFAMPAIFPSIFSSLYTTVDGVFVARRVALTPFPPSTSPCP